MDRRALGMFAGGRDRGADRVEDGRVGVGGGGNDKRRVGDFAMNHQRGFEQRRSQVYLTRRVT